MSQLDTSMPDTVNAIYEKLKGDVFVELGERNVYVKDTGVKGLWLHQKPIVVTIDGVKTEVGQKTIAILTMCHPDDAKSDPNVESLVFYDPSDFVPMRYFFKRRYV